MSSMNRRRLWALSVIVALAQGFLPAVLRQHRHGAAVRPLFVSLSTTWTMPPHNATYLDPPPLMERWIEQTTTVERQQQHAETADSFHVYCDLDGVLVDFAHGCKQLFPHINDGIQIQSIERSTLWRKVQAAGRFFEDLPWTNEGRLLWQAIRHLSPDILTGVPVYDESREQKFRWCRRELGVHVRHVDMAGRWRSHRCIKGQRTTCRDEVCHVITCWSDNKHYESGPGKVLIDDRIELKELWEAKGGIFIHHRTGDLASTLQQLQDYGII